MHGNGSTSDLVGAVQRQQECGLLLVLSGPSGVGKTTVTDALKAEGWPGYVVVTATTRRPREGEHDGVHYHFRTVQQFQEMVRYGELLEHAEVHGNYYGVPAGPVREQLAQRRDVILTIDPQGATTIRKRTKNAIFIFLAPEAVEDLVERVYLRGKDTPEQRALRLLNAEREMAELPSYDYLIVNRSGRLAETVEQFKALVRAEHSRVQVRCPEV
ncbi:MAG: guanylate kinase [Ktedonobacterales bacterium]